MAEKVEWLNKLRNVIQPSAGGQVKGESGLPLRQSLSDGSLDTMARRPEDPEEELRWMSQEFRGYVEAVLNSVGAHVPKKEAREVRDPHLVMTGGTLLMQPPMDPLDLFGASHSRRISDPAQNGDASSASNPGDRHTPNWLPLQPTAVRFDLQMLDDRRS